MGNEPSNTSEPQKPCGQSSKQTKKPPKSQSSATTKNQKSVLAGLRHSVFEFKKTTFSSEANL